MITKEETILKLKKMGMEVAKDQSIVTVLIPSARPLKTAVKEVKANLQKIGYTSSFAVKQYKEDSVKPKEENEDSSTEETVILEKEENEQFSLDDFGLMIQE